MVISRLDIGYPIYPKGSDFHCFYSSLPELLNKEKRAGGNPIDCSHASPNSGLLNTKNPVSGQDRTLQSSSALTIRPRAGVSLITKTKVGIARVLAIVSVDRKSLNFFFTIPFSCLHSDQLISFFGIVSLRKSLVVTSTSTKMMDWNSLKDRCCGNDSFLAQ